MYRLEGQQVIHNPLPVLTLSVRFSMWRRLLNTILIFLFVLLTSLQTHRDNYQVVPIIAHPKKVFSFRSFQDFYGKISRISWNFLKKLNFSLEFLGVTRNWYKTAPFAKKTLPNTIIKNTFSSLELHVQLSRRNF